ncbi:MAG: hypothetical protein ACPGSI_13910 [Pikeienuella sp.]
MSLIPIIGSVVGGLLSGGASSSAANAQAQAARDAAEAQVQAGRENIAFQQGLYDDISNKFAPYLSGGTDAFSALMFELGLGERPTVGGTRSPLAIEEFTEAAPSSFSQGDVRDYVLKKGGLFGNKNIPISVGGRAIGEPNTVTKYRVGENVFDTRGEAQKYANEFATTTGGTPYQGFKATPGYDFRLNEGLDAVDSSVAARQGLASGAALKARGQFAEDYATNEFANHLNRLTGVAGMGQGAAGQQAAQGQYFGNNVGNALSSIGGAQAQGISGAGNAYAAGKVGMANAFNQGIGNAIGAWSYMKNQNNGEWSWL